MSDKTLQWIKSASIRAVKTGAQIFSAFLVTGAAFNEINWVYALSVTGVSMVASVVTSIAGLPEVEQSETIKQLSNK